MPSATPTGGQLQLSVLDANGNKLINEQTILTDTSGAEDLVWTGNELVVFYSTTEGMMKMQRMTSSSSAIGIPTLLFPVPPDEILTQGPSVDWIGDRFVIGWFGFRASRVAYVAADGTLLSPILTTPVPVPDASQVDITDSWTAAGATSDLVVFNSAGVSYAVSLARDGTFGTPVVLPDLRSPTAIWAGTQWIVAARQHAVGQPANTVAVATPAPLPEAGRYHPRPARAVAGRRPARSARPGARPVVVRGSGLVHRLVEQIDQHREIVAIVERLARRPHLARASNAAAPSSAVTRCHAAA